MTIRLRIQVGAIAVALVTMPGMWLPSALAQAKNDPAKNTPAKNSVSTVVGCVQGTQGEGFVLLNPQGGPATGKTQTLTYRLEAAGKNVDISTMVNKRVQVTGTLSAKPAGNVRAPVPDTVRGTGGSGGSGKPGVDHASYFANGVFTVQSIKETSGTCAGDARK